MDVIKRYQNIKRYIVYTGHVSSGLKVHPDKEHLIYPLGCTVIIKSLRSGKQTFLHGHTNNVSCISVSKSGRYIASGQVTFMGFKVSWCNKRGKTLITHGLITSQMCFILLLYIAPLILRSIAFLK